VPPKKESAPELSPVVELPEVPKQPISCRDNLVAGDPYFVDCIARKYE
jgi:hypothetical protein